MSLPPSGDPNALKRNQGDSPPANPLRPSWEIAAQTGQPTTATRPAPLPPQAPFPANRSVSPPPTPAPPPSYAPPPAQAPPAQAVDYDLAGNALPQAGYPASAPGVWPPPPLSPQGAAGGWETIGSGTDRVAKLKWNWGAFLIPFWWCIFNGQRNIAWIIFGSNIASRFIPAPFDWAVVIGQLGLQIYLGVMGHRLAWASGRFGADYDSYIRTQRAWMIWGFALAGLIFFGAILVGILVPGILGAMTGASSHAGGYRSPSAGSRTPAGP